MIIAVAAMESVDYITPALIDSARDLIAGARILVLDGNVPVAGLLRAASIAREHAIPIVADPVSLAKAAGIARIMGAGIPIHTITPNLSELTALTGGGGWDDEEIRSAAARLHAAGAGNVWVTLGADGSFFSSARDGTVSARHLAPLRASVVDATGAGDAMLAAYVAGLLQGLAPDIAAATYGRAAAAMTVESRHTVSPAMRRESLIARIRSDDPSRTWPDE
jgi:pseudouridine kinase